MAREIPLTKGLVAIVDDGDFDWLNRWKWQIASRTYARRFETVHGKRVAVAMHRQILSARAGELADHINGNPLDNRRANLRIATHGENSRNAKLRRDNAIGLKGVRTINGRWMARIHKDAESIYLGCFDTAVEAARAYDAAALRLHGEFARLNFPGAA